MYKQYLEYFYKIYNKDHTVIKLYPTNSNSIISTSRIISNSKT